MVADRETYSVHGRVVRIAAEPKTAQRGGYLFRGLEVSEEEDNTRIFLIFPIFTGDDLYEFPLLCWPGATVAAFNVVLNNRLEDGSIIYAATPATDVVLEPYRPVSVTEAVDAAFCVRSADVRFRAGPGEPFWMAKGKLIHDLFRALLDADGNSSDRAFSEAFSRALPQVIQILPGSSVSVNIKDFEAEARSHFTFLKAWLDEQEGSFSAAEVECDRISTRWGLKGRADAVFHGHDRKLILELKSGRMPMDEHLLQLYGYALLFAEHDRGPFDEGCLLYSATGRTAGIADPNKNRRSQLLQGRNAVVALRYSYTREDFSGDPPFPEEVCRRNGKCFSRTNCRLIFGDASGKERLLGVREQEYYRRWFRLLSIEEWLQEEQFSNILDASTLQERVVKGVTLPVDDWRFMSSHGKTSGEIVSGDPWPDESPVADSPLLERKSLSFSGIAAEVVLCDNTESPSPGEEVLLHPGDPCSAQALRGRVISSAERRVLVSADGALPSSPGKPSGIAPPSEEDRGWFLDRIPFSRGSAASRRALFEFFKRADPLIVRVVAGSTSDDEKGAIDSFEMEDLCFSEGLHGELNKDQERAVRAALGCGTYHLIHGPPGTGKTRVLARLIRLCLDRGDRVLLCCPTNVALDRLLVSVIGLGTREFLRVGGSAAVSPEFREAVAKLGDPPVLLQDLAAQHTDFRGFTRRVAETKLIGATAYQCAVHPLFLKQRFDWVIIDEAGQLNEPSTLAPLTLGRRFVLGGDHLQLPPVVQASCADSGPVQDSGLERSLFERLFRSAPDERISDLKMQYRMSLEVQEVPSRLFYQGMLFPSPEAAGRRLRVHPDWSDDTKIGKIVNPDLPVVFVDVAGSESGNSRPGEAAVATRIVESLLASGVPPQEIGIITPYKAQQALIRKRLASTRWAAALSVDTVDRFQGGEREVIILSLARSDEVTSFLADQKRLNVSLTRARSKVILLGHGRVLQEHPLFRAILEGLEWISVDAEI
jgi:DNA replication ATP-dependent helicase Dna2